MQDKNFFSKFIKYYHTLKYLKPIQLYGQVRFRFKKPKINLAAAPTQRAIQSVWISSILKPAQSGAPNKFIFLNQEKDISDQSIWTNKSIEKLWLYNLHYFDLLNTPTTDITSHWQKNLIMRWIKENPPGEGDGWEPYALSLRIVNWIKWLLANKSSDPRILDNLAIQVRYLYKSIEIHLLGNHLIANAKALLFAGLFFEDDEANKWLRKGFKLFNSELSEQILSDGGHFELSTMYHAIILEDLLDILNLFKTYAQKIPNNWLITCRKMFYWLQNMCHLDNEIAFFNDSTLGIAPTLDELKLYQKRIGLNIDSFPIESVTHLSASGYCRIQSGHSLLLADVAEVGACYQPGHAHADTLSFEFSIGPQRLIVNSGISSYTENNERFRQRGSQAHNTLTINDHNSSEVWKSFRVARRAKVRNVIVQNLLDKSILKASHDGYYHLYKIIHTRTWTMTQSELTIHDAIQGTGKHKLELSFHVHPGVNLEQKDSNCIIFYDQSQNHIAILHADYLMKIVDSSYHPGFNLSVSNKKVIMVGEYQLPMEFNAIIKWNG